MSKKHEEAPGAMPGSSLTIDLFPLLLELVAAIRAGHGQVPEFHVGGGASEVIIGPIPIRKAKP